MKIAKLLGMNDDGEWILEGTIRMVGNELVADTRGARYFLNRKAMVRGELLTKADGERFLDALPIAVNGSYVRIVLEDDPETPQRHGREPEGHDWLGGRKRPGYSSIPRLLLELDAQKRGTPPK